MTCMVMVCLRITISSPFSVHGYRLGIPVFQSQHPHRCYYRIVDQDQKECLCQNRLFPVNTTFEGTTSRGRTYVSAAPLRRRVDGEDFLHPNLLRLLLAGLSSRLHLHAFELSYNCPEETDDSFLDSKLPFIWSPRRPAL